MANTDKMITETVLKDATEKILQTIADNVYNLVPYDDTEISEILEISDEEAMELVKILNDNIIANNKIWSSNKTNNEIQNAIIEANKYADELIGQISSISLEYVTTLPTSDIKSNVIYILQGTPNTLNVYNTSTSTFVSVGDLDLDLSQYYTKSDVDALLADKADDNAVVHQDDVVTDMTTTSGTTVLSTSGLKTELDKKANDDEVVKTIDITSSVDSSTTDDVVVGGKLLYNELLKVSNDNYIEDASNPTSFICKTDSNTLNTPYKEGVTNAAISLVISIARGADSWNGQISISMASSDFFVRNKGAGGWSPWVKLITKNDTVTTINSTSTDETIPTSKAVETRVKDRLKNADSLFSTDSLGISIEFNKEYTLEKSMYDYTLYDGQVNWKQTSVSRRSWYDNDWDILTLMTNDTSDTLYRVYTLRLLINHSNGKIIKFLSSKYINFNLSDGSFSTSNVTTGINLFALR